MVPVVAYYYREQWQLVDGTAPNSIPVAEEGLLNKNALRNFSVSNVRKDSENLAQTLPPVSFAQFLVQPLMHWGALVLRRDLSFLGAELAYLGWLFLPCVG